MELVSKIKSIFPDEALDLLADICDTRRVPSNIEKMRLVVKVLHRYNITFNMLGGATNRVVVQAGGYAIKIALDDQGYKDNFMEFSLSQEWQPDVTKSYETNGYILVQQCVRLLTKEEWRNRKMEILSILERHSHDYLMGDIGYIETNMANYGITDEGRVVILDYAYCHRATEQLFSCEVCGEGILMYDQTYSFLMCGNRSVCHAKFTYSERRRIQGDQVDIDMIAEKKKTSILLSGDKDRIEIRNLSGQMMLDDRTAVIHNRKELDEFNERRFEIMSMVKYDNKDDMDKLVAIMKQYETDPETAAKEMNDFIKTTKIPSTVDGPVDYVLGDDYTDAYPQPVQAAPTDMLYGETYKEYFERKQHDADRLAIVGAPNNNKDQSDEESNVSEDTTGDTGCDLYEMARRAAERRRAANGPGTTCNIMTSRYGYEGPGVGIMVGGRHYEDHDSDSMEYKEG